MWLIENHGTGERWYAPDDLRLLDWFERHRHTIRGVLRLTEIVDFCPADRTDA